MSDDQPVLKDVVYDWNVMDSHHGMKSMKVMLLDETLRDGLQSAYVIGPTAAEKVELVRLMAELGIDTVNIGLPGAGERALEDAVTIAKAVADEGMDIRLAAAARTLMDDVRPIIEVSQASGLPIEVMSFIGSSPIRMLAEEWDLPRMLEFSRKAVAMAVGEGLPVTFVTEDTTRSRPDILYRLFTNAIDSGATRLCLCDTTGHATPDGVRVLLRFVTDLLKGIGGNIGVDWHGHNDRGMALANSLWAIQWGADRIHGCALGVGERTGNTAMEQIIMNLRLLEVYGPERSFEALLDYCRCASRILHVPIPTNLPLAGRDAFRTQTGVHAAAIAKAHAKGDDYLADRVYSGVPAGMFGRRQEICVGPMSGASNVIAVLGRHGIEDPDPAGVRAALAKAKQSDRILIDDEVLHAYREALDTKGGKGDVSA